MRHDHVTDFLTVNKVEFPQAVLLTKPQLSRPKSGESKIKAKSPSLENQKAFIECGLKKPTNIARKIHNEYPGNKIDHITQQTIFKPIRKWRIKGMFQALMNTDRLIRRIGKTTDHLDGF